MGKARPFTWRLSMAKAVRGKRGSTTDSRINNARKFCQFRVPDIKFGGATGAILVCVFENSRHTTNDATRNNRASDPGDCGAAVHPPLQAPNRARIRGAIDVARSN